jgi:prepilin-type N-terminal cleavage/methylation domain-containing protein
MSKTARFNTARGFTLIELLIVITIIISITAAVVPSFAGYIRNQGLKQATEQVKSDLRSIQNKAITGALSDQTINSNPVAYWGVRFSAGSGTGSNRYEYFISDSAATCPLSFNTGQLQGYSEIASGIDVKSAGYKCIYFSMANGTISTINFGSNTLIVGFTGSTQDGDCRRVLFNDSGLIYSSTSQICS